LVRGECDFEANELWLMDDGSDPVALTSNGAENVNLPGRAWCPGNDRIVFASDVESENDEIYSIASDGTDLQRLTTTDALNWEPSWSPDCSQIVFQSDRSGQWDIWRMNADGSNPVQLTDDSANDQEPN
jgi:TolB protein